MVDKRQATVEIVGTQGDLWPSAMRRETNTARGSREISVGDVDGKMFGSLAAVRMRNNAGTVVPGPAAVSVNHNFVVGATDNCVLILPQRAMHSVTSAPHMQRHSSRPPTTCSVHRQLQRGRPEMLRKCPDYVMILPDVDAI